MLERILSHKSIGIYVFMLQLGSLDTAYELMSELNKKGYFVPYECTL